MAAPVLADVTTRSPEAVPGVWEVMAHHGAARPTRDWIRALRRGILVTDLLVACVALSVAQLVSGAHPLVDVPLAGGAVPSLAISVVVLLAWGAALQISQSTDEQIIGEGAEEYSRVLRATFVAFGGLALVAVVAGLPLPRAYLAVTLVLGLTLLVLSRWMWRLFLDRQRSRGRLRNNVVLVGGGAMDEILDTINSGRHNKWNVVGVCHTGLGVGRTPRLVETYRAPVVSDWRDIRRLVESTGADTVVITHTEALGLYAMRELSWDLDEFDVDLVVAPGILDVAGPRMHLRPVSGMPLLHVDKPSYQGATRFAKVAFDKVGATLLLAVASPVLLACAIAVKVGSRGPVFYVSERMGMNNEPFGMIKFRSMVVDADRQKSGLAAVNEGSGPLFKMRNDPRVTPVGRFLRRYSLDELPQLFNVLRGDMSLVGPRPPLRSEVEQYSGLVSRRMMVRPGMTGLWQVSGRSNLSWEQTVRVDLSYVENWSFAQDLQILWRTAKAVVGSDGAY